MLQGTEVKSLREGHANLTDGYAYVDKGEAWLDQVNIPQYSNGTWTNHAAKRNRKLLLHKDEITKIGQKAAAGGCRWCRQAVLRRWAGESRDRHRQGQDAVRQAPDAARATGQARRGARDRTRNRMGE